MLGVWQWKKTVLLAAIGLLLAVSQVWTRLQVVATGYALSDSRRLLRTLEGQRQILEGEWRNRTSSAHLAEQATQRLGLNAPQLGQVVQVK